MQLYPLCHKFDTNRLHSAHCNVRLNPRLPYPGIRRNRDMLWSWPDYYAHRPDWSGLVAGTVRWFLTSHTSTRFIRSDVTASILFYPCHWRNNADRTLVPSFGAGERLIVLVRSSVVEPAGDGLFSWSRSRWKGAGSSLLLCDIGVLRRQSCCHSCKFSQIVTIVAQIVRTKEEEWEKIALENCYRYHWQQMIYHCNFIRPLSLWLLPPQHTCMFQGLGPDGNYGLFPANYVEVIDNSELQIQA